MAQVARGRAATDQVHEVPLEVKRMVFIQAMMEQQCMPEADAQRIYFKLSPEANAGVNALLSPFFCFMVI